MVKLTLVGDRRCYFDFAGFLIGPLAEDSSQDGYKIEWRHPNDYIRSVPSLYGQNHCNQWRTDATLEVDKSPHLVTWSSPMAERPYRIAFSAHFLGSGILTKTALQGAYEGKVVFQHQEGPLTYHDFYLVEPSSTPRAVTIIRLNVMRNHYFQWYKYTVECPTKFVRGSECTFTVHSEVMVYDTPWLYWNHSASDVNPDFLRDLVDNYTGPTTTSTYTSKAVWYMDVNLPVPVDPEATDIRSLIDARLAFDSSVFNYPGELKHYGDLANTAVNGLDAVQMNMISFLKELPEVSSLIPKLKNLRKLRNAYGAAKDASDAFLTAKYGWMPTVSDLQEIARAALKYVAITDRNGFRTSSARSFAQHDISEVEYYSATQCVKLAIAAEDNFFLSILEKLEYIGMFPSFNSLWDLVPYSFVLDWFIDLGDFLEAVDTRLRISRLDIRYVTMSLKVVRSKYFVPSPELPFVGNVNWVEYRRWTSHQCPLPPLSLQTNLLPTSHWLEGSALILQRMR